MTRKTIIWGVMVLGCTVQVMSVTPEDHPPEYMSNEDREMLKEEARDMFYHAYNAYMDNAYPADELMPLSCKGRYRKSEPDRGDIDSTLGNFSLTLVDTLDTLVVLGDLGEFENAVRLVVKDVTFDTDVIVSLFETNIRMLGGLLSGHILAEYLQSRADIMPWYRGELLNLAKDLGYRFLPAFNTTTGIPFGRINLRHGMKGVPAEMCRETCTACAGSMILEMAALSRLTGESIFEDKAQKAMDALWKMRHRGTDLMGSVLNVHSGDWVRRDSGVGAGIDSYYEYCLKAYILLGDEKYLGRFNKHYQAVMKYVSQGPMLLDVHMHRPNTNSKNFMDALLAFWPGLQVLKGDIKPAVETHEMLYQVMQRHNFIPEAFTTDFQVHWGHHPLRPEFLESTYFLYRATGDHYYLGVGRKVLKSLQTYARVPCGYAAVSDVRTNKHDDTMDSFVLSETLKYLFLLFAEPNDLVLDLDEFIFTTEGHLLPLTLAAVRTNVTSDLDRDIFQVDELGRTCPNSLHLFPASVRQPLRNMVEDICPRRSLKRRLNASQFQANNLEHLKILSNMGITILTPAAGQVQVLHTFSNARTAQDAEEGLLFMQEVVEMSKKQSEQSETRAQSVTFLKNDEVSPREVTLLAGPAHFGPRMKDDEKVTGVVEFAKPLDACSELMEPEKLMGKIVILMRGNCMFVEKARRIQSVGAIAGIVLDSVPGSSAAESPMFAMSGDGRDPDDVTIPVVFLFDSEATQLAAAHMADNSLIVTIGDYTQRDEIQLNAPGDLSVFERLKGSVKDFINRQVTPQNSASRPTEPRTSLQIFTVNGGSEYKYNDFHLKALLLQKPGIVKIVKNNSPPPSPKNTKSLNKFEKIWYNLKQYFVDEVYSSNEKSFVISLQQIQFQYNIIHKLRGLEVTEPIKELEAFTLTEWYLKELKDVSPDNLSPKIKKNVKEKIVETLLEELIVKSLRESIILHAINTGMKLFDLSLNDETKKDCSKDCSPGINLDSIIDKINFDEIWEDWKVTDNLTEIVENIFYSEFLDFNFFLVADIDSRASKNIFNRVFPDSRDNEKTIQEVTSTTDESQGYIFRDKGIVRIKINNKAESSQKRKTRESTNLEGFEKIWYDLRQFLINFIHAYDDNTIEISIRSLKIQYYTVQYLRGNAYNANLESMVTWYLNELRELSPEAKMVDILYTRRTGNNPRSKLLLETEELLKRLGEHGTAKNYQSRQEDDSLENFENSVISNSHDGKINRSDDEETKDKHIEVPKILNKNENDDTKKNKIDESRENLRIFEIVRSKFDNNAKLTSKYETSFSIKTENEKSEKSIDDIIETSDPMEEFKKPVWAPDDGKDGKFSNFHGKSHLPDDNYKYTTKNTEDRAKTRRGSKRIEDDL